LRSPSEQMVGIPPSSQSLGFAQHTVFMVGINA
jgi:hypothetical protein